MSRIYTQLAQKIRENHLQSLTLDIFDTVLLYRFWPEQQHDIAIAKKWHQSLPDLLGLKLSPLELIEWRKVARHELTSLHYLKFGSNSTFNPDYETWFAEIISLIDERYNLDLDEAKRELIQQTMLRDQLQATAEMVKPNLTLIKAVRDLKTALPDLKVYFLADEPYSRDQIQYFLDYYKVDIFDGGTTSVSLQTAKQNGELFQKVIENQAFGPDFQLKTNLHVGDSHKTDYLPAKKQGSFALHYRPIRMRTLRTLAGFVDAELRLQPAPDLFGDRRSAGLSHLGFLAKNCPDRTFLLISTQADNLKFQGITLAPKSFTSPNIVTAPSLNQHTITRALTWLLLSRADQRWNLRAVFSLIHATNPDNKKLSSLEKRRAIYEFCFGPEYPVSSLILEPRSDQEFFEAFLQDFVTADPRYVEHLREAYATAASFLPRGDVKVTIVDNDPSCASARLFREFAKLHSLDNPIDSFTIS